MLNTAKAPPELIPLFEKAQEYVSKYFQTQNFDPTKGTIEVSEERYILIRAASISTDFFSMVREIYGESFSEEAIKLSKAILFDTAHSIGRKDAKNFSEKNKLSLPVDKLSVGPIHFSHTGWAFVEIFPESNPSPDENYFLIYDHLYSFESDAWLKDGQKTDFPVCVMNAGYSSGWCEESFGIPLVATEILCKAKGDPTCRFAMAPPSKIKSHIDKLTMDMPAKCRQSAVTSIPVIGQWKEQADALKESEERFRSAFQNSGVGMAIIALDGKFLKVNPAFCKSTGYSESELKSKSVRDISHKQDIDSESQLIQSLLDGAIEFFELEKRFINKKGETIWFLLSVSLSRNFLKQPQYFILHAQDQTESKLAKEKLRNAEKQLIISQKLAGIGELASGICHEILNPLNIISIQNQFYKTKSGGDPKIELFCDKIKHEVRRIEKIVKSLLEFAREGKSTYIESDLREEVEKVLSLIEEDYNLDNIKIERQWCCEKITLTFDPDKIRQVIFNLFNNAHYAMPQGGTLTVGCHPPAKNQKQCNSFFIKDTGIGMSEKVRANIFNPFFTTKPEGEGTGMGLSIVYGIISEHDGKINVESKEGKGSTFTLNFLVK